MVRGPEKFGGHRTRKINHLENKILGPRAPRARGLGPEAGARGSGAGARGRDRGPEAGARARHPGPGARTNIFFKGPQ